MIAKRRSKPALKINVAIENYKRIRALNDYEFSEIETEVMQLKEWSGKCPARCTASATRENYIKLFYAYVVLKEQLKRATEDAYNQGER